MITHAANTPMMMNTAELVPPESDWDATEPLVAVAGSALSLAPAASDEEEEEDEELLNEPFTDSEKLPEPLTDDDVELDVLLEPATLDDVDLDDEEEELVDSLEELVEELLEALEEEEDEELDAFVEPELEPDSHLSPLNPPLHVQPKLGVPSEPVDSSEHAPWPLHCTPLTLQPSAYTQGNTKSQSQSDTQSPPPPNTQSTHRCRRSPRSTDRSGRWTGT